MKISNTEAIISLNPNAQFKCNNDDIDTIKWLNGTEEISKSTILAEVKRLQADYDAKQYQRDRAEQYPSIADVVVALAEKQEGDDTMWQEITAQRAKVKSDNPKTL